MWIDQWEQDYDYIEREIRELEEWIYENPGKFDGVAEKQRTIRELKSILREMREQANEF